MIIAAKGAVAGSAAEVVQAIITVNGTGYVYYTKDGVTWTLNSVQTESGASNGACGFFDNQWVVGTLTGGGSGTQGEIWYTNDATFSTWSNASEQYAGVYGSCQYMVVGGSTAFMLSSRQDGVSYVPAGQYSTAVATWTAASTTNLPTGTDIFFWGAATNGSGTWLIGGDGASGSNLRSSTNLTAAWTSRTVGFSNVKAVAFGGGTWIAAGTSGNLRSSTDLATWTSRTSQFSTTEISAAAYGNGLFVIVGLSGKISTSTDGATWTARTSGVATTLADVQYSTNLGLWIVCGTSGTILTSPDAITWTDRTIASPGYNLNNVGIR